MCVCLFDGGCRPKPTYVGTIRYNHGSPPSFQHLNQMNLDHTDGERWISSCVTSEYIQPRSEWHPSHPFARSPLTIHQAASNSGPKTDPTASSAPTVYIPGQESQVMTTPMPMTTMMRDKNRRNRGALNCYVSRGRKCKYPHDLCHAQLLCRRLPPYYSIVHSSIISLLKNEPSLCIAHGQSQWHPTG